MSNKKDSSVHNKNKKNIRISYFFPSAITLAGTCSALTGVRFAMAGEWEKSVLCIFMAAIFDGLDGRVARMLNATSEFGEILDSLSDFVAFGVAPAFIMYFWVLQGYGELGWAVTLFFVICTVLRLARFNFMIDRLPAYASNYFQGLNAPSAALVVLTPMMLHFTGIDIPKNVVVGWVALSAVLMVSVLPMFAFKKNTISAKLALPLMVLFGIVVISAFTNIWLTLSSIFVLYLLTIPLSYLQYKKNKKKFME